MSETLFSILMRKLTRLECLAACLMITGALYALPIKAENSLPTIPTTQPAISTAEEDKAIGRTLTARLNRQPMSHLLAPRLWLEDLTTPLANHSDLGLDSLELFLLNNPTINAFAAPGGIIGLNTGLLINTPHVEEVIAVISHEIAHLTLRHYSRQKAATAQSQPAYIAALLASVIAATQVDTDLGIAGIHATVSSAINQQMKFSRQHEQEADRVGLELMFASKFDGTKMLSMLKQLDSPLVEHDPKWAWARSHPISSQRIADLTLRMNQQQAQKTTRVSAYQFSFDLLKILLRIENFDTTNLPESKMIEHSLQGIINTVPAYRAFAQALIALKNRSFDTAQMTLATLSQNHPTNLLIWDAWMQTLLKTGQTDRVIDLSQQNLSAEINPTLSQVYLARGYAEANQLKKAITTMYQTLKQRPVWIGGWKFISEWAGKAGLMSDYHIAQGHWHLLRGEVSEAELQIHILQNRGALTHQQDLLFKQLQQRFNTY